MSSGGGDSSGGISRSKDGIPQWGGDPATFSAYEEESFLWEQTQPWHKRHMCAPKLKAELSGAARRLILGQAADWGAHPDGVSELMKFLRARLGQPQLPELSELMNKYFRATKRKGGESINDYVTRKVEAYMRAQQSLQRVLRQQGKMTQESVSSDRQGWGTWGEGQSSRRNSMDSRTSGDAETETPAQDDRDADGEASTEATTHSGWGNQGSDHRWQPWWSYSWDYQTGQDSWGYQSWSWHPTTWQSSPGAWGKPKPEKPVEILPDYVQGWLLLVDAGLDIQERNAVQTALRGEFSVDRVATELRAQWPDAELQRRDRNRKHHTFLSDAILEDEEDDAPGDMDAALLAEEGLNDEGMALITEAQADAREAYATLERSRRTLREARARQHEVRQSRKYYKVNSGTSSYKSSGPTSQPRDDSHLTCLKCGRLGHRAANCPDKGQASANHVEKPEQVDKTERPVFAFGNSSQDQCLSTAQIKVTAGAQANENLFPVRPPLTFVEMPSISSMNKTQLLEEIEKLGGVATLESRRLELQNQLQSLMEENQVTSLRSRADNMSEYQKMTREMNRAGAKKSGLIDYMTKTLRLNPNPNHTVVQLRKVALEKIYLMTTAEGSDPVGFGKFASLSYSELQATEKEYITWVRQTAREGGCCPQLSRLAQWLEENPEDKIKKGTSKTKGYPPTTPKKTMMSSSAGSHSEPPSEGASSVSTQVLQQLVGALQGLQQDVHELKAERRQSRPRKENHADEEMISDAGSYEKVSSLSPSK
ncbi:unnamed protein product [Symbiodinium microadriaticum]|nr:unnamed protein product [Symbiodinium microadriaticum]